MRRTAGMTIVEVMTVCIIICVLASVAVVTYTRVVRRAIRAEVASMLGEIRIREEAYFAEFSRYVSTTASRNGIALLGDETLVEPALSGSHEPQAKPAAQLVGPGWQELSIQPPRQQLYCGYVVIAANKGMNLTTLGAAGQQILSKAVNGAGWFPTSVYYARACCDLAGDGSSPSPTCPSNTTSVEEHSIASTDSVERVLNEGQ
jgi:type II secretory pathway pseudopilin PulG